MFFASDNGAPCPRPVMDALLRANDGPAMGYGNDPLSHRVAGMVRAVFEAPGAAVYLVATGTAANSLALALLAPPWGAVFCHAGAHVQHDECGAPEFFTGGAKLILVPGTHGRMTPEGLAAAIDGLGHGAVHAVQRAAVTITNVTEAGTVYTPDAIAALAAVAKAKGMGVHLDGARFANALAATGATAAEMTWKAGVDIVTFGGTKDGLLGVEAVVIFDPARAWEFELRRKRAGHLFSKHRFLAAQVEGWLEGGLWLDLARHANAMAARLAAGLGSVAGARLIHPVEANIIFATFPRAAHDRAQAAGAVYYQWSEGPDPAPEGARLVCSWATTAAEVDGFIACLR
ncbi:MAG: threonine aldolase family protein [Gemmobacter sp.]